MQIANEHLRVEIAARGAELRSIRTPDGAEWLWNGDPAFWTGRSPLLFPVIGRSPDNHVSIGGSGFPMAAHGFARILDFAEDGSGPDWARFTLAESDVTRASFPFAFQLSMTYRLDGTSISCLASVSNIDSVPMPFQFGFHPGFVWPLPGSDGKPHSVSLGNGGTPALYRLNADKLLIDKAQPSPFVAGRLQPDRTMFEDDAMLFPAGAGNSFSFAAEGGARIDMKTANLPHFAIWQKPGAPFLCLEPWHGTAPLAGTGDALETRNGAATLSPGEQMDFRMELRITAAQS